MTTLANRLKQARKNAGLTQSTIAQKVGITQPTYQALESGKVTKTSYLLEIAQALQVNAHWLATGEREAGIKPRLRNIEPRLVVDFAPNGKELWPRKADDSIPIINQDTLICRQVPDESMDPFFRQGDFVFADESLIPETGDYVIARLENGSEVIRRYREYQDPAIGEKQKELVSENDFFPSIKHTETPFEIVGTIFEYKRFIGMGLQMCLAKQHFGNEVARLVAEAINHQKK